jgi:hypothetical protein
MGDRPGFHKADSTASIVGASEFYMGFFGASRLKRVILTQNGVKNSPTGNMAASRHSAIIFRDLNSGALPRRRYG